MTVSGSGLDASDRTDDEDYDVQKPVAIVLSPSTARLNVKSNALRPGHVNHRCSDECPGSRLDRHLGKVAEGHTSWAEDPNLEGVSSVT